MSNDLIPTNIDEISRLKGLDKVIALNQYHEALERQRKQDKQHERYKLSKIWHAKNPEKQKEYSKKAYKKLKEDKKNVKLERKD